MLKGNCDICGALWEVTENLSYRAEASSLTEKSLGHLEEQLLQLQNEIVNREQILQSRIQQLNKTEATIISKENEAKIQEQKVNSTRCICKNWSLSKPKIVDMNALEMAASEERWSDVQALLRTGKLSVEHRFENRKTVLILAAEGGNFPTVQFLTEEAKAYLGAKDNQNGRSALHWASYNGHFDIVKYLVLEGKANASEKTSSQETPLHIAARRGFLNIVGFLVRDAKVDVLDRDFQGMNAIHHASKHGHLHIVKFLCEMREKKPIGVSNDGSTALHFATQSDHLDVVMYLLKSKAEEQNTLNHSGYRACAYGTNPVIKKFCREMR